MADPFVHARLESDRLDPARELADLLDTATGDGAVVSFVGMTRPQDGKVAALVLEHHPVLTEKSLQEVAREAGGRFAASRIWVVHRCGTIGANQPIVFAAATAAHRRTAFAAADYLMDRLKTDAVFWKREEGPGGSRWIEPTDDDYDARKRWSD